jgi:hypothetical protein
VKNQMQRALGCHEGCDFDRRIAREADGNGGEQQLLVGERQPADHHAQRAQKDPGGDRDCGKRHDPASDDEDMGSEHAEQVPAEGEHVFLHRDAHHMLAEQQDADVEHDQRAEADDDEPERSRIDGIAEHAVPAHPSARISMSSVVKLPASPM